MNRGAFAAPPLNRYWVGEGADPARLREEAERVLPAAMRQEAQLAIGEWPDFQPTPLHDMPGLAGLLGIARLWCKNESSRLGLGSFKALGGAYAVEVEAAVDPSVTVACATEGNHGRSVAWGANRLGLRCVIYLHEGVSAEKENAIARYGAEIRRVSGNYDDAVRTCARESASEGWTVVSDTSWPGYDAIPRRVMAGYTVMTREIVRALADEPPPTHVFLQGGVGGLAGAAIADLCREFSPPATKFVLVEPARAACLLESLAQAKPTAVPGPLDTIMAGLACGEPSPLVFPVIAAGATAAVAIDDAACLLGMRYLSAGKEGDPAVLAGPSGAAGLAGLLSILGDDAVCAALGLGQGSRVLVIATEGDTDPSR